MIWLVLFAVAASAADFQREVRPVLESQCLSCHVEGKALGDLRLDTAAGVAKAVRSGNPDASPLMQRVMRDPQSAGAMPPGGTPLSAAQKAALREWISAGAVWPEGLTLKLPQKAVDDMALVAKIRERILANQAAEMKAYRAEIPSTGVGFDMVPIPGGKFRMGSPESEKGRGADEGPVHEVELEPFWMGAREVTWDEYRLFMFAKHAPDPSVDAVSRPTRPYVEMSFGMGINGYPAISMTQHAANKYAQWLSGITGHFYRLPTEAEWEYACRAGTTTAFSFGDDEAQLSEYAVFLKNSADKYAKVGTKKPNPWGLYDMHGNVSEWTLDGYDPKFYARSPGVMPLAPSTGPYPQVARGGGWTDPAGRCRCAARLGSDPSWKMQDPQLPKSIWYLTDAQWLGFRLVRPRKVPSVEEMFRYWNNGVESE